MSPDIPPAPPEAEAIRLARLAADMTAEDAAEASREHDGKGVSASYWRDVERGRGGRRGQPVPVRASERALAVMARVVGLAPAQLTEAGREDAARILEEILRREDSGLPAPTRPARRREIDFSGSDKEALRPFRQAVLREVYQAVGLGSRFAIGDVPDLDAFPGIEDTLRMLPPSRQPFRTPEHERDAWDTEGLLLSERITLIARMRLLWAQADEAESRQTGLAADQDSVTGPVRGLVSVAGRSARASH